jgi:hypothetical protein
LLWLKIDCSRVIDFTRLPGTSGIESWRFRAVGRGALGGTLIDKADFTATSEPRQNMAFAIHFITVNARACERHNA